MPLDTISAFVQSYQAAQGYTSHAARQLTYDPLHYSEDKAHIIESVRRDVTLGSVDSSLNHVMTPLRTVPVRGWHLDTKQSCEEEEMKWFFLSKRGKLLVIWEGLQLYATLLTMRTLPTALLLLTEEEIRGVAHELKTIARK